MDAELIKLKEFLGRCCCGGYFKKFKGKKIMLKI